MTPSFSKPAVVVVHGVWHSPLTFTKFNSALQLEGYDVYAPFLPSCAGSRPPTVSMSEDTQLVRRLVEMLAGQGRSIIVVAHSYGGVPVCSALEGLDHRGRAGRGLSGGVTHILAISAHIHPTGFSVMDIVDEMGDNALIPLAFDVADDNSCFPVDARASFFAELPREEADMLLLTLSRANYAAMNAGTQFEAWRYIPVTYLHTLRDATMPAHYQKRIMEKLERLGCALKVVEMDTGHSPYITRTSEVVEIVNDLAKKAD